MQPADGDPNRKYPPLPDEPHSVWSDVLLVSAFVLFIYIFIATGGFIPAWLPPTPTPFIRVPPKATTPSATASAAPRVTPSPAQGTPTPELPKFFYQQPDIRGAVIVLYTLDGKVTGAYVRGKLEADTRLAQAFVKFTDRTRLWEKSGNDYQLSELSKLVKGDTVEVFLSAPADQSAGSQAVAEEIVVLK
jgi:hypothetical protein